MQPRELSNLLTRRDREIFSSTLNAIAALFEARPTQARASLKILSKFYRSGFDGCLFRRYAESTDALRVIRALNALGVAPDHIRLACYAKPIARDPDDASEIIEAWAKRLEEGWKNLFGETFRPSRIALHRRPNPKSNAGRKYLAVSPVFPSGTLNRTSKGFWGAVLFAARWFEAVEERQRAKQRDKRLVIQEAKR
jgi:hypothetical protein